MRMFQSRSFKFNERIESSHFLTPSASSSPPPPPPPTLVRRHVLLYPPPVMPPPARSDRSRPLAGESHSRSVDARLGRNDAASFMVRRIELERRNKEVT